MNRHVYPVRAYEVHDGDTVKVTLDLGFRLYHTVSLRLKGVDAPEISDEMQRPAAEHVRLAVADWLYRDDSELMAVSIERDKYADRIVGDLLYHYGCESLAEYLLSRKLARPYDGGKKNPWTAEELAEVEAVFVHNRNVPLGLGTLS